MNDVPVIRVATLHCENTKPHPPHPNHWNGTTCPGTSLTGRINQGFLGTGRTFTALAGQYAKEIERSEKVTSRVTRVSRVNVLRAQIANMQQELTELERFPGDRFEVGTIIAFDKVYADSDTTFYYAAVKATDTQWYLSGIVSQILDVSERNRVNRVDWERLTYVMRDAENVRVVFRDDGHSLTADMDYVAPPNVPAVEDPKD